MTNPTVTYTAIGEMQKAIDSIGSKPTNVAYPTKHVEALVDELWNPVEQGFFCAFYAEPGVKIDGLLAQEFNGGTLLSTYCAPERVVRHYKSLSRLLTKHAKVALYSTPQHLQIFIERR